MKKGLDNLNVSDIYLEGKQPIVNVMNFLLCLIYSF